MGLLLLCGACAVLVAVLRYRTRHERALCTLERRYAILRRTDDVQRRLSALINVMDARFADLCGRLETLLWRLEDQQFMRRIVGELACNTISLDASESLLSLLDSLEERVHDDYCFELLHLIRDAKTLDRDFRRVMAMKRRLRSAVYQARTRTGKER